MGSPGLVRLDNIGANSSSCERRLRMTSLVGAARAGFGGLAAEPSARMLISAPSLPSRRWSFTGVT